MNELIKKVILEITAFWKTAQFRFLEKRRSFIRKSVQFWNCFKSARIGPYGRPITEIGATHLGLPSECANGPSNLGPRILKVGAIHQALSGEWTRGAQ